MNTYKQALHDEMKKLSENPKAMFLGQQVGTETFYGTMKGIHWRRRTEMPVAEELQMGMSIGLALEGFLPVSIYQRMDFLPRACDQLVNHLGIIKKLSKSKFKPKVIIRTTVGSTKPLDTGLQHSKDLYYAFKVMCKFPVIRVRTAEEVHKAYEKARKCTTPIMIVEYQDLY